MRLINIVIDPWVEFCQCLRANQELFISFGLSWATALYYAYTFGLRDGFRDGSQSCPKPLCSEFDLQHFPPNGLN